MGAINWKNSYGYIDPESGKFMSGFIQKAEQKINNFYSGKYTNQQPVGGWRDYITALGFVESTNSYNAISDEGKGPYYGIYQIGKSRLIEAKYFNMDGSNNFSNIMNMSDFLMQPYAQDDAILREMSGVKSLNGSLYLKVKSLLNSTLLSITS